MFATLIVAKVQSLGHVIMNEKTKIDSNMITETGKRMAMCKKKRFYIMRHVLEINFGNILRALCLDF